MILKNRDQIKRPYTVDFVYQVKEPRNEDKFGCLYGPKQP